MKKLSATPKRPPGRPRKSADEKLEQFSIRLPPKLKLGLELLARAQARSLSQAVEWTIQVGLHSYKLTKEGESVAELVEEVWEKKPGFPRAWSIYLAVPTMLGFEERAACELVEESRELADAQFHTPELLSHTQQEEAIIRGIRSKIVYDFVEANWEALVVAAAKHFLSGKQLGGTSLVAVLGMQHAAAENDVFSIMQAATELGVGAVGGTQFNSRAKELDEQYVWTATYRRGMGQG